MKLKPPIAKLRETFTYNPATGVVRWVKTGRRMKAGAPVGTVDSRGRLRVEMNGATHGVHQIAFALYNDRWPKDQIDHINHDKMDNRIANLREATNAENSRNRPRKTGGTRVRGVCLHKGRYIARVMVDGRSINLGSFDSAHEASAAYRSAVFMYHGEFAWNRRTPTIGATTNTTEKKRGGK